MNDGDIEKIVYKSIEYYFNGMSVKEAVEKAKDEVLSGNY